MFKDWRWYGVPDGDVSIRQMLNRHYSARKYRDNRRVVLSGGPGFKMILLTIDGGAGFIWRKFIDAAGQTGVNCAMFRNESSIYKSSELILEAEELAWRRWPGERLYTYIDPKRVKSSNPGYCFFVAGWSKCGVSGGGKIIMEKLSHGH